jgi:hypothetical protein
MPKGYKIPRIQHTTNYAMFKKHDSNRDTNARSRKQLEDSMKLYGFLPCFAIVVMVVNGNRVVLDGQHRLEIATKLGLAVYYMEVDFDFDIAVVNSTQQPWKIRDYAVMFAENGNKNYEEALTFSKKYHVPLGRAFAMLAGVTTFDAIKRAFIDGRFKIKDRAWAESVAEIYVPLASTNPVVKGSRFLEACMAVCRVTAFDPARLIKSAKTSKEMFAAYSTRDAYLDMLEQVYNNHRSLFPLKIEAMKAMRARNVAISGKPKKKDLQPA